MTGDAMTIRLERERADAAQLIRRGIFAAIDRYNELSRLLKVLEGR